MSTASATSTDTVILEDATESEVAEDVGESPTMPSPVYVSILREAPGEPHRDSSTVPARKMKHHRADVLVRESLLHALSNHVYKAESGLDANLLILDAGAISSFYVASRLNSSQKKQSKEAGAKLEDDLLICGKCVAEKERKEREEREAALERERAAAKANAEKEAALAAA
ncbi:hypothetical protein PC123_g5808 [Phytophthora cactorum]|nr:hypothetical protein PC123_g5808 [Phytophthora cactorum]